jgi:hypothetical protein
LSTGDSIGRRGATLYGLRAYIELAIQRYKRIFGNAMKARELPQKKTEAWVGASALNKMRNPGMSVSVRIPKEANIEKC